MKIARRFTSPSINPLDDVKWVSRDSAIRNPNGKIVWEMKGVIAPEGWSQTAIDVAASKYLRKAGLPHIGGETSIRQLVERVSSTIAEEGERQGVIEDTSAFRDELAYILVHQIAAFNSPVWFNCGLFHAYGATGKGGSWAWNEKTNSPEMTENDYQRPQCSACMPYETLVNTNEGLIPIGEIAERFLVDPKTMISTYDREGKETKIIAGICNGKRYVMEFELDDGTTLRMTSDHVVFAQGKDGVVREKQAGDLVIGEESLLLSRQPLLPAAHEVKIGAFTITSDLAWISGVMVGNGFSGRPPSATSDTWELKVNTAGERSRVEAIVGAHGLPFTTTEFHWGFSIRGYGCAGKAFWERLGLWSKTGAKEIPEWVFRSNQELAGAFLQGLFDTDGTVAQHGAGRVTVQLSNTSWQVICGARLLLRSLGVFASTREYSDDREDSDRKNIFYLTSNDVRSVDLFAQRVGFTHDGKHAELEARSPDRDASRRGDKVLVVGKRKVGPALVYDIQTEAGVFWAEGTLVHNCFIMSVKDDLAAIYEQVNTEVRLFRHGSGTGSNFSNIRSKREKILSGGTAAGLMSFLEVFDKAAGATKSGGATRRSAKMVCVDMDHPEIVDFITWKMREEKKVRALIAAGYPSDFNGEAYQTVSGQNSNNSVRVTDEFMRAVERDGIWKTWERTTKKVVENHLARDLWTLIVKSAWASADPGVQFHDTMNRWNTCKNLGPITASNPCGEFVFPDDSACNLASLNLVKFIGNGGSQIGSKAFDQEALEHVTRIMITAQEILVDLSSYPTAKICENSHNHRPLGIGYANLGALLMRCGLPYDSDEARTAAAQITNLMTAVAYHQSSEIAREKGPFDGLESNFESMADVIGMHHQHAAHLDERCASRMTGKAMEMWQGVMAAMHDGAGVRNAQISLIAPTGTIGLMMDCDTTGVEPDFALVKTKKLAGSGMMTIVNGSVVDALQGLGYTPKEIVSNMEYILGTREIDGSPEEVRKKLAKMGLGESQIEKKMLQNFGHGTLEGAPHINDKDLAIFDCADGASGTRTISPMAHLKMVAAVQPFVSGAISKTINMPASATVDDVSEIYMEAWKMGVKGITIYRDGSKASQPLTSGQAETPVGGKGDGGEEEKGPSRRKLPSKRRGITYEARVGGHKIFLRTGEYQDGKLGEIFVDMHKEGAAFRSVMNALAMSVSMGLQYGVPLEKYVKQFTFTRFEPQGIVTGNPNIKFATSILDYLFRVLGYEYLGMEGLVHVTDDGGEEIEKAADVQEEELREESGAPICPDCGHQTVRSGTCHRCTNCGATTGCS